MKRWQHRPEGSNWGDVGEDDQRGKMNLITQEIRRAAAREAVEGIAFCLSLPLDYPGGSALIKTRKPPRLFADKRPTGHRNYNFPWRLQTCQCEHRHGARRGAARLRAGHPGERQGGAFRLRHVPRGVQRLNERPAPLDRFAYLGYVAVAKDERTALERGRKLLEFPAASERIEPRFINPPGSFTHADNARILRAGDVVTHRAKTLPDGTPMSNPPTPREQIINAILFAGTPDQVYEQIARFYESVGGFGNLLVQMGGTMATEEIVESLTLFAEHVQPRLDALTMRHRLAAE